MRLERLPSCVGIIPCQLVAMKVQFRQVREVTQFGRYRTAQPVAIEIQSPQVGETAQLGRYCPGKLVLCRATALLGWRDRQVPSESLRSARSRRGSFLSGWRGCPVRSVSALSTGCLVRYSSVRLERLPSCVGIVPVNWLPQRYSPVRLVRDRPVRVGIVPVNWFTPEVQSLSRLSRDRPVR